jgi:hypothetical protein
MRTQKVVYAFLIGIVALLWATPASAADRNYWRHSKGHFENTEGNKWVEKAEKDATHNYVEKERTEKYVELYDKSRDAWVRLFDDRCMYRFGDKKWERLCDGSWGKK